VTADLQFTNLLLVAVIAVAAPLVASALPVRVPAVVLEIVAGIVAGPAVLGWVEVDEPVAVLALVGVTFLLFLAGMEIDLHALRGATLRLPLIGFLGTLVIGFGAGLAVDAAGWVSDPLFLTVAVSATALGVVAAVLKDSGQLGQPLGQLTLAGATVADFAGVLLLSLVFAESDGGAAGRLSAVVVFVLGVVVVTVAARRVGGTPRVDAALVRLQDTTAAIRVRIAVAILLGFVALAARVGLETILGAFVAGAVVSAVDRDTTSHPHFRLKLESIGYGFVVPVFFVSSGLRFDLEALREQPEALWRVPAFVCIMVLARGLPAVLYRRFVGGAGAMAAGLLQATSLPFIVTATQIGVEVGAIDRTSAAALVAAGLVSMVVFPALAIGRLRGAERRALDVMSAA
jgi:Kef-type K+ transport system membrane component KefB